MLMKQIGYFSTPMVSWRNREYSWRLLESKFCIVLTMYEFCPSGRACIPLPVDGPRIVVPGLPLLEPNELLSFVYKPDVYPAILLLVLCRNSNVDEVDWW
ncbi:hypothetical protein C5167_030276 [Papaver somniferum]|nr:hypothetical protein C5167_030276 [Papaver somniferum]